jgi:hypothetical protein
MEQAATYLAYHVGLFRVARHPWGHPGLLGGIALAVHPRRPGHTCRLAGFVQASPPPPFGNLTAFVCGQHTLPLGSPLAVGRLSTGSRQDNDATAGLVQLLQEAPLRRRTAGEASRGEEDDGLQFAQARLIPQAVQGWAIQTPPTDPVIQKERGWNQGIRVRGHVCL